MEKMLTELCHELNNYFWREKIQGHFVISNGEINVSALPLQNGQCFRIIGSVFNDGVHRYPAYNLVDEEFDGAIWSMAVPAAVIDLASEIEEWNSLYGGASSQAMSPFNSESFGNYSYSKSGVGTGGSSGTGNPNTWQSVFAARLNRYRRIRSMP